MDLITQEQSNSKIELLHSLKEMAPKEQEGLLRDLGGVLGKWGELQNRSSMEEARILYEVKRVWEYEDNLLSLEAKAAWSHDFYEWAKQYIRSDDPAQVSIDNRISVYRDWEGEGVIGFPPKVYILKDPEKENPSDEDWEEVEFDPEAIPYSKLLVARAKAKDGELSEDAWSAIVDPRVSVRGLKRIMKQGSSSTSTNNSEPPEEPTEKKESIQFYLDGSILMARKGDSLTPVAYLTDEEDTALYAEAAAQLLKTFNIEVPTRYRPKIVDIGGGDSF